MRGVIWLFLARIGSYKLIGTTNLSELLRVGGHHHDVWGSGFMSCSVKVARDVKLLSWLSMKLAKACNLRGTNQGVEESQVISCSAKVGEGCWLQG
jgi:hypothetical protein